MSLPPGHKLAHYEIVEPIGKGGMGEVYRARDGKLGRDVAIKVLPEEFAENEERLARFKREAKVLASLNHPNIASIYGLEQSDETHYLDNQTRPTTSFSSSFQGRLWRSESHAARSLWKKSSTSRPRWPKLSRKRTNTASFTET